MEYKFSKALYRRTELLTLIDLASSTLDTWISKLKSQKRDLRDMGCYQLKGCKYDLWNPVELIQFIMNEQLQLRVGRPKDKKVGFGHEEAELEQINHVLTVVNNNHKQKGIN
tara:strand:+ start:612 stop:947 length:336 start_codon:yes stop_codon:yes gene_type:complete